MRNASYVNVIEIGSKILKLYVELDGVSRIKIEP